MVIVGIVYLISPLEGLVSSVEDQATNTIEEVRIGLAGDTMLGRNVDEVIGRRGYRYPWGDMLDILGGTDLNLVNLETTLTRSTQMVSKVFNFKAHPDRVKCLVEAKIDVCTLANNHILDFEIEGMIETIKMLDQKGIAHVGAGRSLDEARQPLIITRKDITIGIIGCTDNEPSWTAGPDTPGTHYVSVDAPDELKEQVKRVNTAVDILILSIHWGPNMREKPSRAFIQFAHQMIDAGVDIFHGHSAHIFQGIEVYKNRLILYDTGDFVDDYYVTPSLRNDQSFFYIVWSGYTNWSTVRVSLERLMLKLSW